MAKSKKEVTLISNEGNKVTKSKEEADKILAYCKKIGKDLWKELPSKNGKEKD